MGNDCELIKRAQLTAGGTILRAGDSWLPESKEIKLSARQRATCGCGAVVVTFPQCQAITQNKKLK